MRVAVLPRVRNPDLAVWYPSDNGAHSYACRPTPKGKPLGGGGVLGRGSLLLPVRAMRAKQAARATVSLTPITPTDVAAM